MREWSWVAGQGDPSVLEVCESCGLSSLIYNEWFVITQHIYASQTFGLIDALYAHSWWITKQRNRLETYLGGFIEGMIRHWAACQYGARRTTYSCSRLRAYLSVVDKWETKVG
jgi:hypothetical protein